MCFFLYFFAIEWNCLLHSFLFLMVVKTILCTDYIEVKDLTSASLVVWFGMVLCNSNRFVTLYLNVTYYWTPAKVTRMFLYYLQIQIVISLTIITTIQIDQQKSFKSIRVILLINNKTFSYHFMVCHKPYHKNIILLQ